MIVVIARRGRRRRSRLDGGFGRQFGGDGRLDPLRTARSALCGGRSRSGVGIIVGQDLALSRRVRCGGGDFYAESGRYSVSMPGGPAPWQGRPRGRAGSRLSGLALAISLVALVVDGRRTHTDDGPTPTTPRPTSKSKRLTPSQDLVICAVTNGVGATGVPQRPKTVRLVVKTVRDDGSVLLDATAWEIPR
jgi:hypothetical protein